MTISNVDIANLALTKLGVERITTLSESSEQARAVNAIFEILRDSVLRDHPWNFAMVRIACSRLTDTPTFEYSYYYQKPSNCLRIIEKENQVAFPYKLENSGKIATDDSECKIRYIKKETDPNAFDSSFIDAFATRLAAELCFKLTDNVANSKALMEEYKDKIRKAKSNDSQEDRPESWKDDPWRNARNAGVDVYSRLDMSRSAYG